MKYKKSKYNIFVPYEDSKTIIFNSLTGSIGLFDEETMEKYNNDTFSLEETELLLKKGILVDCGYDELSKVNNDRVNGIKYTKGKFIRVWTTSACNARCYYCFEKGIATTKMTKETADQLVVFIDNMLNDGDKLTFEWFGGEPLLNVEIIDYIIDKLEPICVQKKCRLTSTIISNGSLITEEIVNKMIKKWNVSYIQITLDGDKYDYDRVKNYFNPKKFNFDKIIENIKLLSKNNIHVSVRMNYDTNNYDSLNNLIDYLYKELAGFKNIFYYVYPIWSSLNDKDDSRFISQSFADDKLLLLLQKIASYKLTPIRELARLNYKINQCVSCNINSYTVLPDGKLAKCSETFRQIIGDIWNGVTDTDAYNYWTNTGLDNKCEACVYLPLCQGGCRSSHFTEMPQCFVYKDILDEILKWYVSDLKKHK